MMSSRRFAGLLLAVTPLILIAVIASADSARSAVKNPKIWTDGAPAPLSVPAGFNPMEGFAPLVKRVKPAVVNIATTMEVRRRGSNPWGSGDPMNELFRQFFGDQFEMQPQKRNSLGSGLIVNADGYILTNNHVVEKASEITIKFSESGSELPARVVGRDEKYDLALLKVDAEKALPVADFGDSDVLEVGEWVVAIGNPFGLTHTVTAGIVSAKDRVIGAGPFDDFIQTDASINPGNSGGPLFNARGQVVGINTAIHAAGQGIGFAVPINMAKRFITDVMTKGKVTRGWLGVGIQPLTPELSKAMSITETTGVVVSQVFADGPAHKADIRQGDVIVSFDGKVIDSVGTLTRNAGMTPPGTKARIELIRELKRMTVIVEIGNGEDSGDAEQDSGPVFRKKEQEGALGLHLSTISPREQRKFKLREEKGVVVIDVDRDGPSAQTGIRPGDIMLEVNRRPIKAPKDFKAVTDRIRKGDTALLLMKRGESFFYAVVKKP